MVTVNGSPSQSSAELGLTVYIKSCGDVVPATKVNSEPKIVDDAAVLDEPPIIRSEDSSANKYM